MSNRITKIKSLGSYKDFDIYYGAYDVIQKGLFIELNKEMVVGYFILPHFNHLKQIEQMDCYNHIFLEAYYRAVSIGLIKHVKAY